MQEGTHGDPSHFQQFRTRSSPSGEPRSPPSPTGSAQTPSPARSSHPRERQHFVKPPNWSSLHRTLEPSATTPLLLPPEPSGPLTPEYSKLGRGLSRKESVVLLESEAKEITNFFDFPRARQLTLLQVLMSLGYIAYMMTSWVYVSLRRRHTFPVCYSAWPFSVEMRLLCHISALSFWTFPLLCCLLLVVFFYRELLHTRLYYVMLAHRVLLDFSNVGFFDAYPVRWMLVFMFLASLMYPLGGMMTMRAAKATLPYWIPVLSFGGMIYTTWDLETRLLSIAKFVERNVNWAKSHLAMSYFVRDYVAEHAYWNIHQTHAAPHVSEGASRLTPRPVTTGQFIEDLVEECERLELLEDDHFATLHSLRQEQAMTKQWTPDYWVTSFLLTKQISDNPEEQERQDFRYWFRIYLWYTVVIGVLLTYFLLSTVVTHLHHQGMIRGNWWTSWFELQELVDADEVTGGNGDALQFSFPLVHALARNSSLAAGVAPLNRWGF